MGRGESDSRGVSGPSQIADARRLAAEVVARCRRLAEFSEDAGSTRRTFLSPPMRDVHREIASWLAPLGVNVRIDAAGNLRAEYPAARPGGRRLLIGSHLDTVPNAGAFDGILGVVIAVALLQGLQGKKLPFAIEVAGFSEEEGVRFGTPFIGSRAMVGRLDDELLAQRDAAGVSVRQAIGQFGLNPAEIRSAQIGDDVMGYVEFHIEQGPVLEKLGLPLAAVDAIAGQSRMEFTFTGRANHAGTTPMSLRSDAMAAAAEWIVAVEREARAAAGLVATVGSVKTKPGVTNVIAGETRVSLDVRHRHDAVRHEALKKFEQAAEAIAQARGLSVRSETKMDQAAVEMDAQLKGHIAESIRAAGCVTHHMVSGAGHDAMIVAERVPAGMIFLRTPGGVSHDPAESVSVEDVEKAIVCGLHLLERLTAAE